MVRTLVAAGLAALLPAAAPAQTLTLDDAIARALAHNPATRSAAAAEDEARARAREAASAYLPRLDAVEGWQRGDHPVFVFSSSLAQRRFTTDQFAIDLLNNPDPLSNHRAAIVVEQTVFDRTLGARIRGARTGVELAGHNGARVKAALRLAVVQAYADVVAAAARHLAARAAVAAAAEDLRRTEDRRDVGLETEANVLALRVHASGAEEQRVRAEADETVARAALNALLAEPLDASFDLPELPHADAAAGDVSALEALALENRPELREAHARRTQAQAAREAARGTLLPRIVALGGFEANGGSFGSRATAWTAGIELRWSVFTGGADFARVASAAAAEARAAADAEASRTSVLLDVRRAYAMHRAARARELTSRRTVEQAKESQRITRDRYDAGLASATELLRTAEALSQAEAARTAAVAAVQASAAALAHATGTHEAKP